MVEVLGCGWNALVWILQRSTFFFSENFLSWIAGTTSGNWGRVYNGIHKWKPASATLYPVSKILIPPTNIPPYLANTLMLFSVRGGYHTHWTTTHTENMFFLTIALNFNSSPSITIVRYGSQILDYKKSGGGKRGHGPPGVSSRLFLEDTLLWVLFNGSCLLARSERERERLTSLW